MSLRMLAPACALPLLAACQGAPAPTPVSPAPAPTSTAPTPSSAPATSTPGSSAPASPSGTPASWTPAPRTPGPSVPPPTASSKQGKLIDYRKTAGENGVEVKSEADVARLGEAPDSFKQFIRGEFARLKKQSPDCPVNIAVTVLRTDGYAVGSVNACGGAVQAWAAPQGAWREIWGGQEAAPCAPFKQVRFPAEVFAGLGDTCAEGGRMVPYA